MMNDQVWYGKQKIGKNPLSKFMTDISEKCNLSQIYTNHCIRVTGISILTRIRFSASEIMSVSGHKSVQSLAIYQKTDNKKKREMGDVLAQAMSTPDDEIQRKCFKAITHQPKLALPAPTHGENAETIEQRNQVTPTFPLSVYYRLDRFGPKGSLTWTGELGNPTLWILLAFHGFILIF